MEINEHLDRIAETITKVETLNAIHACRPGHPLGRDNEWKWRNAYALVSQGGYFQSPAHSDMDWLRRRAEDEHIKAGIAAIAEQLGVEPH